MSTEEKNHGNHRGEGGEEVLTVEEAASLLRLNRKTVYEAIDRGELPGARRIGRKIRVCRATLLQWLAQGQGRVSHSKGRKS